MKQIVIVLATLAAFIAPAQADGLYTPDVPDDTYEAPAYAFTGFGIGIQGGGQFGSAQLNGADGDGLPGRDGDTFDGIAHDGLIGGAHLEYMFAVDRFRFGAYGEGGFSNANTTLDIVDAKWWVPGDQPFNAELKQKSYYGFGLKAGVTVYGDTLLFVRGGYDWSQWELTSTGNPDIEADVGSWLGGVGIDTMVAQDWSLGLGVDYLMVDDVEDAKDLFDDSEIIRAQARLTRRF